MKIFRHLPLSLLLLAALPGRSQEEFVEPPSKLLTSFEFRQISGGVIILRATLDDFPDTLQFILDSGSSGISLDSATVSKFGLVPVGTDRTIRGIAGIRKVGFLYNRKLRLPGLTVDSLNFHVNDYSTLTSVYGEQVDGIIGYALLSRYIVKLNYDLNRIQICSPGTIRYPKGGYLLKPTLNSLPVHMARIRDDGDFNVRFLHDIGAGVCLMLSQDFIDDSALLGKKRKLLPKEGEGIGGSIAMSVTVIKELRIGPYRFRNIPTYIFNDTYNVTSYPYLGGLIGNDIFRRFNVIFNYPRRDIHLVPNTHFRDAFDYSYSGVEIYFLHDKILIGNVSRDCSAFQSGLREGDEIMAIDNDFTQNFQRYKAALQAVNQRVKVLVKRDGAIQLFEFRIRSIL